MRNKIMTKEVNQQQLEANQALIKAGKSAERVHKCYKMDSPDWKAQYNMLLMDGVTCADCYHADRCRMMFGGKDTNTYCQFYPSRFTAK